MPCRASDHRVVRARRLRRDTTDAERKLWQQLRRISLGGSHFRRQATSGPFFADFACHEQRLIIELDGGQHNFAAHVAADAARTEYLNADGYRVLQFWNNDVLGDIDGVMTIILQALRPEHAAPPTPVPSPPQAGGGGPRGKGPPHA